MLLRSRPKVKRDAEACPAAFSSWRGARPHSAQTSSPEWRAYLDVDEDLPVFCPECAEREFGGGGHSPGW